MSRVRGTAPGAPPRNGIAEGKPYLYRGRPWLAQANAAIMAERLQPRRYQTGQPCGTAAALKRHTRAGEKPCEECLEAERRRQDRRRARGQLTPSEAQRLRRLREREERALAVPPDPPEVTAARREVLARAAGVGVTNRLREAS